MNTLKYQIKPCLLFLLYLLLPSTLFAQEESVKSPWEVDSFKENEPILQTFNASALSLSPMLNYGNVELGTKLSSGDFKRAQQGKKVTDYLFSSEGAVFIGNIYLMGGFDIKQAQEKDVMFNSIMNPYRGTPYIIADSSGGDWKKQSYDMWVKGSSPFIQDRISFGLDARLSVGRGSKKIDPRPQASENSIQIAPSFTLKHKEHALGANLTYRRSRENVSLMLYDTGESQKIYLLKGMGQYTFDIFSTNERKRQYEGDAIGGGVQYTYRSDKFRILLDGLLDNYVEDVQDIENSKPRKRGRLYETKYHGGLSFDFFQGRYQHRFRADYSNVERSGREIIQVFNPSAEVNAWETDSESPQRSVAQIKAWHASYDFMIVDKKIPGTYQWKFSLEGHSQDFTDEYAVMDSYLKWKSHQVSLNASRNILLKKDHLLQFGLSGSIYKVNDVQWNYTAREADDKIIEDGLIAHDVRVMSQNYSGLQVSAMYAYTLKNKNYLYLKGAYQHIQTEDRLKRNTSSISIGYNF